MKLEKDYAELLGLLNKHDVRYCVVGSFALAFHARPRYTKDIDILIEPSPDRYRELARVRLFPDVTGEPWAPLALSNGKLLIRDGKQMVCVDLRNPG